MLHISIFMLYWSLVNEPGALNQRLKNDSRNPINL